MIKNLFFYKSDSFNPYENLAVEKYLTDSCPTDSMILYLWQNDNTVVIGQNQNPYLECSPDGSELYIARRLSGGGAVYHDKGNLNFTFITSVCDMNITQNMEIIQASCAMAGIETSLSGRNDLLAEGKKFSGNAFYNTNKNAYHHGTIMINCDTERMTRVLTPPRAKLEAKGIKSVRSRVINLSSLNAHLTPEKMSGYMLSSAEKKLGTKAEHLMPPSMDIIRDDFGLFSSREYIYHKTPPFTKEAEAHFCWGNVRIMLEVKKNIITSASIYTDAMDWSIGENFKTALADCEYERGAIFKRLSAVMPPDTAGDLAMLINDE